MAKEQFQTLLEQFKKQRDQLVNEMSKVIIGQLPVMDQMLAAIFVRSLTSFPSIRLQRSNTPVKSTISLGLPCRAISTLSGDRLR